MATEDRSQSSLGFTLSRRRLLQAAGIGGTAVVLGGTLSACGGSSGPTVNWSNWPAYLDTDDAGGYPSLAAFTEQTGIEVVYTEDVNDNNEFFAKVRTQLEGGQDTERDLVVLTDWMAALWIQNGYAQKLDLANIPNAKNLLPKFQGVAFDPNREYTLPWQSGFGALGWNKQLLQESIGTSELRSLDQLWDPALKGRISVLSEMRDTMGIILAWQGADPSNFTDDQWSKAIEELQKQVGSGQIRQVAGNDYIAALESKDVIAVIGWSGDMFQLGEEYGVALPESGGTLWTDNMLIPALAQDKASAEAVMNYYYDPKVAAEVAAYVQYITPVAGAREAMAELDPALVDNPWIFPSDEMLANSYVFMSLTPEQNDAYQRDFESAIGN